MTKSNFNNYLTGLEIDSKSFNFIKEELEKQYDIQLFQELIALPCMRYKHYEKLKLALTLIEDNEINDSTVWVMCEILNEMSDEIWKKLFQEIENISENRLYLFDRKQQLRFTHALEVLFAKGFPNCGLILQKIYSQIQLSDHEFSPNSEENVRIRLAKCAYNCNKYNAEEKLRMVEQIKKQLKRSGNHHMLGIVRYYKGLCIGHMLYPSNGKDKNYYIIKAANDGFDLAIIYREHIQIHSETSRNT